jgi:hypothetical protein
MGSMFDALLSDAMRCPGRWEKSMTTEQDRNKAFVLEAFDVLFNKSDYARAQRYWSDEYIQHSAHIGPGRDGLFGLVRSLP